MSKQDVDRDAYHDYRPDPKWEIESHLAPGINNSKDESAIPAFARQLEGALDGYHKAFCQGDLDGVKILPPPGCPDDEWSRLRIDEKFLRIYSLQWTAMAQVAMNYYSKKDFDAKNLGQDKEVRPYMQAMLRTMPNWFRLKDYFLEGRESRITTGSLKYLRDTLFKEDEAAFKKRCRNTMGGFYAFRNYYVNGMIGWLRIAKKNKTRPGDQSGDPVNIVCASVGSEDLTSDYDLTVSGPDDVPAAAEFNRSFRYAWGVEAGTLFDTNVYYRNWMLIDDKEIQPMPSSAPKWEKNPANDTSLQPLALDFFGDIYSLVKVRRYCEHDQWSAFVLGVQKGIEADRSKGVPTPFVGDIPRFKRLALVDEVYRTQFLTPLLQRLSDVKTAYERRHKLRAGLRPEAILEHLIEYNKNAVIRAMNIAFVELGAKVRVDEQKLKEKFPGDYKWVQSGVDGKPREKNTGLTLHGLVTFLERYSELMSEATLFANEPYFSQGAIWVVVGGQAGKIPQSVTVEHYLQSFNEQLGDSLKELQEYLREFEQRKEAAKADPNEMNSALDDYNDRLDMAMKKIAKDAQEVRAVPDYTKLNHIQGKTDQELQEVNDQLLKPVAEALLGWRKEVRKYYGKMTKTATGFYRASKYELRLREMLLGIHDKLKEDPVVKTRNEKNKLLFPDRNTPDNKDLMLLTQESVMAGFYDKYVKQLLDIRKGRESYIDYSPRESELATIQINDNLSFLRNLLNALKHFKKVMEDLEKAAKQPGDRKALKSAAEQFRLILDLVSGLFLDERVSRDWMGAAVWASQATAIRRELVTEIQTLEDAVKAVPSDDINRTLNASASLIKEMTENCETLHNSLSKMGMHKVRFQGAEKEEAGKIMQRALRDPNFDAFRTDEKRLRAEVDYQKAQSEDEDEDEEIFGLAELIHHLLWHGALVNQLYRSIRSRGPVDLYVRHLALE